MEMYCLVCLDKRHSKYIHLNPHIRIIDRLETLENKWR